MQISIITLFPKMFEPLISASILDKARESKKLEVNLINLRDFGLGSHKQVDDRVYGGGVGMILRVEPIDKAIQHAKSKVKGIKSKVLLLTPQGKTLRQETVKKLAKENHLILICGKYEGVDERVRKLVDAELSIGDYVLSGGEVAAMVVLDAVSRLIPGVLDKEATEYESFSQGSLEPPQYTRPEIYKNMKVPKVLLSGNHKEIEKWRREQALKKTKKQRPDLLKN